MTAWAELAIEIAGTKVHMTRAGKGPQVSCCIATSGRSQARLFHDELAKSADVIVPHHPGWGARRARMDAQRA
jgi:hypothetical protein